MLIHIIYIYRKTGKDNGHSHHQAEHNHILELDKGELDRAPLYDRCHKPRKDYHSHVEGRHRRIRAEQHEEPTHTRISVVYEAKKKKLQGYCCMRP